MEDVGFEMIAIIYFFIFITPLLFLRKFLDRDAGNEPREDEIMKYLNLHAFINKVLLFISKIENKISKFLPNKFGGRRINK